MTTTTADKGELLPCPFCGSMPDEIRHDSYLIGCNKCEVMPHVDYIRREDAIAAWNRRTTCEQQLTTNEGQDGLREPIKRALNLYAESYEMMTRGTDDGSVSCKNVALDIRQNFTDSIMHAIARHLSSKQADQFRDATQMVKADAVKMPEPAAILDGFMDFSQGQGKLSGGMVRGGGYVLKSDAITAMRMFATAHTAEAVRELVDGLQNARNVINLLWVSHHANRSDDALERCDALLAKYAPSQEGANCQSFNPNRRKKE